MFSRMLRGSTSRMLFSGSQRFSSRSLSATSALNPGLQVIVDFFKQKDNDFVVDAHARQEPFALRSAEQVKYSLVGQIVVKHYHRSRGYLIGLEKSAIKKLIQELPIDQPPEAQLAIFVQKLYTFPPMPTPTSHPTRIFSNAFIFKIHSTIKLALGLDKEDCEVRFAEKKRDLLTNLENICADGVVQEQKLTPEQESEYVFFIFQRIIETFPEFLNYLVDAFHAEHGMAKADIEVRLKPAVMFIYQKIMSWVHGDSDGNYQINRQSMERTLPMRQLAILDIFINKHKEIQKMILQLDPSSPACSEFELLSRNKAKAELLAKLSSNIAYYERCYRSIKDGIWFSEEGSEDAVRRSVAKLSEALNSFATFYHANTLYPEISKGILSAIDLIELIRFTGGMQEFVRQTTFRNNEVFDNLFSILSELHPEIRTLLACPVDASQRKYTELTTSEKKILQEMISSESKYFASLRQHQASFSEETQVELNRMFFILRNEKIFKYYICSNTESDNNFAEVCILMRFAQFILDGSLRIGHMNKYAVNMLFLVESPKDMQGFEQIMRNIFETPALRARIVQSGILPFVLGPSDMGVLGGVGTHLTLNKAQMQALQIFREYKLKYPELGKVRLQILMGFGPDYKRRIQAAIKQLHSTFQGIDAYLSLGAPYAYLYHAATVAGRRSQGEERAIALENIAINRPDLFDLFLKLEKTAVSSFEEFISQPAVRELLNKLVDLDVENLLNISSRAARKVKDADVTKLRAIGIFNVYLYMILNFDIFMSALGWESLTAADNPKLCELFTELSELQDVVYKIMFAIAVSDIDRSWKLINGGVVPSAEEIQYLYASYNSKSPEARNIQELLAFIQVSADMILSKLMLFAAPHKQTAIEKYLSAEENMSKSVSTRSIELMEIAGEGFAHLATETRVIKSDYKQLAELIDIYTAHKSKENMNNLLLGLRGVDTIFGGPKCIALGMPEETHAKQTGFEF